MHVGSILHASGCVLHHLFGRRFFEHRFCIVFGGLTENFARKPNSSENTSHDYPKAGGVTPWREELRGIVKGASRR